MSQVKAVVCCVISNTQHKSRGWKRKKSIKKGFSSAYTGNLHSLSHGNFPFKFAFSISRKSIHIWNWKWKHTERSNANVGIQMGGISDRNLIFYSEKMRKRSFLQLNMTSNDSKWESLTQTSFPCCCRLLPFSFSAVSHSIFNWF